MKMLVRSVCVKWVSLLARLLLLIVLLKLVQSAFVHLRTHWTDPYRIEPVLIVNLPVTTTQSPPLRSVHGTPRPASRARQQGQGQIAPEKHGDPMRLNQLAPEELGDLIGLNQLAPEKQGDPIRVNQLAPEKEIMQHYTPVSGGGQDEVNPTKTTVENTAQGHERSNKVQLSTLLKSLENIARLEQSQITNKISNSEPSTLPQDHSTSQPPDALLRSNYSEQKDSQVNDMDQEANRVPEATSSARCTHQERIDFMRRKCLEMKEGYAGSTQWQQPDAPAHIHLSPLMPAPRMYANTRRHVAYCQLSKVACTTWTGILSAGSLGLPLPQDAMLVHRTEHQVSAGVIRFGNMAAYQDYLKFLVVRHPLDRILSAYYNIVNKIPNWLGPEDHIVAAIMERYKIHHSKLTFEQFVDFLTDKSYQWPEHVLYDRHFDTYAHACNLCEYDYDYVIRFESMAADSAPVLKALNLPQDYFSTASKIHSSKPVNGSDTSALYLRELQALSEARYARLMERYAPDMELFGYGFDRATGTAYCSMQIAENRTCC